MICRGSPTHTPQMGGCVGGWLGQWVNDIYDLYRHPHPYMGGMGGSVGQWVGSGQIINNLINLDLIEIIEFCLKIYDL